MIKDWLGGLFLLSGRSVTLGDSVTINGISGGVEEINLFGPRFCGAENGAVHIIANGSITSLSNFTRDYSYYVFEITLAHGADVDRALEIVESRTPNWPPKTLFAGRPGTIQMMGVERLAEGGVTIKARIKTLPSKQAVVGRELNRRVKARLDAEKIRFPPPLEKSLKARLIGPQDNRDRLSLP